MRFGFLSTFALLLLGVVVATPVQEESSMTVDVAETVSCEGTHFIVSVQRTDDIKEDSGELIAAKVSNIIFDFNVDREAEELLINGHALKLVPQRVRKISLLAVVIPPNHPALPEQAQSGSIQTPEVIDALNKLERNGLVTADVDLLVVYEGDVRQIVIHIQVIEVEGKLVIHKDLLITQITLPLHGHHDDPHQRLIHPQVSSCSSSQWFCRLSNWVKSLIPGCGAIRHLGGSDRHRRPGQHGERHRFSRPRRGFMRFIISVLIPVLIGAAVGVGIGILSVFVVEIIGGIVMKVRGRRNAEYTEVDRKDDDDNEEELPVYEELEESSAYPAEKQ